jgi:hypothetical protein
LQTRLESFLDFQIKHTADGWHTISLEENIAGYLKTNQRVSRLELRGKVDRIDYNPRLKELRIYDYKISENELKPESYHRTNQTWNKFQLPAYYNLISHSPHFQQLDFKSISLGLINLPRNTEQTGHQLAEWNYDDLNSAHNEIIDLIDQIAEGNFNTINPTHNDYNWLCASDNYTLYG